MREFKIKNGTFIKLSNKSNLLINRYGYALIGFTILTLFMYLVTKNTNLLLPLIKSIGLSLIISILFGYIINIIDKNNNFLDLFTKDYIYITALIIGLFGVNTNIVVLLISVLVSLLIKKIYKGINLSAALYGVLVILIYKYYNNDIISPLINFKNMSFYGSFNEIVREHGTIIEYLSGIVYLSPILSIIAFIYLFCKKSIKYGIIISYILTFSIIMFGYGLFNDMIWHLLFQLICGNILFLTTFTLSDYMITPTLLESQIIYGVILAIISSVLRFIIPELAIVIPFILGPILLTKPLENISPKLKYSKKFFYSSLGVLTGLVIITTSLLVIKY